MNRKIKLIIAPVWLYLNQQISDREAIWNMAVFWHSYKIQLLRKCWDKECSQESHPY